MFTTPNLERGSNLFSKNIIALILVFTTLKINADLIEDSGNLTLLAVVGGAYLHSYYKGDTDGQKQLAFSLIKTVATTYALKFLTKEKRPNGKNNRSFPSAHTSIAFSSSTYLLKRYSFVESIPFYIGSLYVGYSRVESRNHYARDVLAGAVIGSLFSYFRVDKFKDFQVKPLITENNFGVGFSCKW